MKKHYVIYKINEKLKKGVFDDNMLKTYKKNPEVSSIVTYENEMLMEKAYAETVSNKKKTLLD